MGLDMYLYKVKWLSKWDYAIRQCDEEEEKVYEKCSIKVLKEVAYWRKCNQIHNWFVENVQDGEDDCGRYSVSLEQIKKLRDLCKAVLEKDDFDFSEENLPTVDGFFFGNTDYDEYYKKDLKETIEMLDEVLEDPDKNGWEYEYTSSW